MLFSAIKDSAYFSKINVLCMGYFGFDLIPIDNLMDVSLVAISGDCRRKELSTQEAATQCMARAISFLHESMEPYNWPTQAQLTRWAEIVERWVAQGLVKKATYGEFSKSIENFRD